jgi:uncharacterized membrane protein YeaQ/YmgE (transglycosylase-associated protein family)
MEFENIIVWILLGAVAGWIASILFKDRSLGLVGSIVVGILGSFVGGWLAPKLGISGAAVGGFSIASIFTAVGGAVVLLFIIRLLRKAS